MVDASSGHNNINNVIGDNMDNFTNGYEEDSTRQLPLEQITLPLREERTFTVEQQEPAKIRNSSLSEMYDLQGLATEAAIISVVWGILFGVIVWVADLITVRLSSAWEGSYVGMDSTGRYVLFGIVAVCTLAIAFLIRTTMSVGVNAADQVYGWLVLSAPLLCLIILLTGNSLWSSIPFVILLIIMVIPVWALVPRRVESYRNRSVPRRYFAS